MSKGLDASKIIILNSLGKEFSGKVILILTLQEKWNGLVCHEKEHSPNTLSESVQEKEVCPVEWTPYLEVKFLVSSASTIHIDYLGISARYL